jgi:hypothetical protein
MTERPPANPFLADSAYAMAHGDSAQQDSSGLTGPTGPTEELTQADLAYAPIGPTHFGMAVSGPYPDGRRVLWSNGGESIVKLDHESLEVLATHPIPGKAQTEPAEWERSIAALDGLAGQEAIDCAIELSLAHLVGLAGVYYALDRDNTLFVGGTDDVVAYADDDPTDPASPIVEIGRWARPEGVTGGFVGANMTFDGHLVLSTEHGWLVSLSRSLDDHRVVRLTHAEEAEAWGEAQLAAGRRGYGWVRTSLCVDEAGGVYCNSRDHLHKVIWDGTDWSTDEADGAWRAMYRNQAGHGSGTTPCLMGFGADDRFVVIGDGDDVVNITLMWRDEIPEDWEQVADAPSRRIAGLGRADMGDADIDAIQTEQSITVSGYGAMTVNNEPAIVPEGFPEQGRRLLVGYLGSVPAYTPKGLHKYEWDPDFRSFGQAWVNTDVSSPNAVPFVSEPAGLVYTVGARDGRWTVEALDWASGASAFHYVLGGNRYNSMFAGVMLDQESRLVYGTAFGKVRINR